MRVFRRGSNPGDANLVMLHAHYWGDDGIDNDDNGLLDIDDPVEDRTYTVRATSIVRNAVVELETLVARTAPTASIDPNNPPGGLMSAVSVQVSGSGSTPVGAAEFFNSSNSKSLASPSVESWTSAAKICPLVNVVAPVQAKRPPSIL